ncbi:MAG: sugar phosphate nucleotidyltransferase [Candidatus Hydrogenedentes bacterium]|nr:sugar phosphate nucleotidyltransferase [Candidatus Hydrogenedentota bacterium]
MPAKSNYQGVILAAGHGSRMGPFGNLFPKPIIPIANKPLLVYQLEHMKRLGIEEVIIVIGHLGHRITQVLGDGTQLGVRIKYVEQEKRLGIAHAVGQLETCIDRPFMLFLGDIFFELTDLNAMVHEMEQHGAAAVLAVREETDPEAVKRNFCAITREDGSVRRVIEKPRQLPCMTKGCGLYLFDLSIFDAIRHTPRTAMRDEYEITDSIQILIDYEYPVRIAAVVEFDINVTYIGDLITCSRHVLQRNNLTRLVGNGCRLASGVELVETVLGDNVVISKPARLERCVVLSGVSLDSGIDYADAVLTQEGVLRPYLEA